MQGLRPGGTNVEQIRDRRSSLGNGMVRLSLMALGLTVLFLMQACLLPGDPGAPGEVAVSTSGGALLFRVITCQSDELVRSVALVGTIGEPNEGSVFWRESSDQGSTIRDYQVGKTSTGFVEEVPLTDIHPDSEYVAQVRLASRPQSQSITTVFVPSELRETMWEVSFGSPLTDDELDKLDGCG